MVFSLYYVAFMFLVLLLIHGLNDVVTGREPESAAGAAVRHRGTYMFVALKRVYGEPPGRTFWKTLALLSLTFPIDVPINMAAMMLSVALT